MKTLMKYALVGIISMGIGGVLGWQMFRHQIRRRAVPFDRERLRSHHFDFYECEPLIDFNFTPEGNTFIRWGGTGEVEKDLDAFLAKLANASTTFWVTASFNSDATVRQVRDIDARIRRFGFSQTRMLIEDNRDTRAGGEERRFSEVSIGPSNDFYWHQVEWVIDAEQEEATKHMKKTNAR